MAEAESYPRKVEGRDSVIELFPSVFWTRSPGTPEVRDDSERFSYFDLLLAAEDLGLNHVSAGAAFNNLYDSLRNASAETVDYVLDHSYEAWKDLPSWQLEAGDWSYDYGHMGNPESRRRLRRHLLLGVQAAHDSYLEHIAEQPSRRPALQGFVVLGHLLGVDQAQAFEDENDAEMKQFLASQTRIEQ